MTDPAAPVRVLAPEHRLLTWPNRIGPEDWDGWVRERGLYFAADWDPAYVPLLAMADAGEAALSGALLAAPVGRGRHVHVALALHHQFPALVPGAFRLLARLRLLRGTPFDPFGRTAERRAERRLIAEYEAVLDEIAAQALRGGINALVGGGSSSGAGIGGLLASLIGGAPGRATGGPVSPGRAYVVGERGPELFVPTTSGAVAGAAPSGGRDVRVAITINAGNGDGPRALQQSSRQVARAVKAAIEGV